MYYSTFTFVQKRPCRSKWRLLIADKLVYWATLVIGADDLEIETMVKRHD